MPQAALNYTQQAEKTAKIIQLPANRFCFSQMVSAEDTAVFDDMTNAVDEATHKGMDNFPIEVYNQMIEYSLNNGKFRNAMLMICMANWGMRYSDVVRVRFGHLFDSNGQFKESFSLPNGEKKTKKSVVYYNNKATESIISLYLNQPENQDKTRLDFLFVSESSTGNCPVATVQQLESDDLYNAQIETVKKTLKKVPDTEKRLLEKYIKGKITDDNFNYMSEVIKSERIEFEKELDKLIKSKRDYISPTPNADKIYLQKPLSHTAGEDIIKDTLKKIGINPKNRKGKSEIQTTKEKYNTHSLRKTFADWFIKTGENLINNEELSFNETIMDLLKEKFKHSSRSVTAHYTDAQEQAFKTICKNMNIGLEVLEDYMYGG